MSILKNVSYLFTAQTINLVTAFATSVYATRILGAEGRGMNAIFTNALNFATLFFGLSINSTIVYFINSGKISLERLIGSLVVFCFFSTFCVAATLKIFASLNLLDLALPEGFHDWKYLALFAALHFNALLVSILTVVLTAYKKFKYQSLLSVVPNVLTLLTFVFFYYAYFQNSGGNNFGFVLATTLIFSVLNLFLTVAVYVKEIGVFPARKLIDLSEARLMLTFSSLAYAANVLQFLSYRLDFWIVDAFAGKAELGVYSLVTQLAQLVWILPNTIAAVLYAEVADDGEALTDRILFLIKITFYLSFPLYLIAVLTVAATVPALYGQSFIAVVNLFPILLIGVLSLSHAFVITGINAGRGRFKLNFSGSFLGAILSVILYPILIGKSGITGAVLSSAIIYLAQSLFYTFTFLKAESIAVKQLFVFSGADIERIKQLLPAPLFKV